MPLSQQLSPEEEQAVYNHHTNMMKVLSANNKNDPNSLNYFEGKLNELANHHGSEVVGDAWQEGNLLPLMKRHPTYIPNLLAEVKRQKSPSQQQLPFGHGGIKLDKNNGYLSNGNYNPPTPKEEKKEEFKPQPELPADVNINNWDKPRTK